MSQHLQPLSNEHVWRSNHLPFRNTTSYILNRLFVIKAVYTSSTGISIFLIGKKVIIGHYYCSCLLVRTDLLNETKKHSQAN